MNKYQLLLIGSLITVSQLSLANTSVSCEMKPNGVLEATLPWQNVLGEAANVICRNAFKTTQNSPKENVVQQTDLNLKTTTKLATPPTAITPPTQKLAIVQRFNPAIEPKIQPPANVEPMATKVNPSPALIERVNVLAAAKVIRFDPPKPSVVVFED